MNEKIYKKAVIRSQAEEIERLEKENKDLQERIEKAINLNNLIINSDREITTLPNKETTDTGYCIPLAELSNKILKGGEE